ncbi:hypothetical protein [Leifsonia sp. fls2-241-R2A-40a]|uniref:hypothetical protein n=1 Tax=Leifsonia sp. fls2-241-R2A-40a TaxID=3040290 RepID=UPI00254BD899|nr:hypothetical protein [Leifsonia sp. fls2-241-R2A-40a]
MYYPLPADSPTQQIAAAVPAPVPLSIEAWQDQIMLARIKQQGDLWRRGERADLRWLIQRKVFKTELDEHEVMRCLGHPTLGPAFRRYMERQMLVKEIARSMREARDGIAVIEVTGGTR